MPGTNMSSETSRLKAQTPQILVGTPGRALDHLQTGALAKMTQDLRIVIFDEADNILDMGFRPTIEKILGLLPPKATRQTLLFSATFPNDLANLCKYAFKPNYQTIDTVGAETGTNVQVDQLSCVVSHDELMLYLLAVIRTHMQQDAEFKVRSTKRLSSFDSTESIESLPFRSLSSFPPHERLSSMQVCLRRLNHSSRLLLPLCPTASSLPALLPFSPSLMNPSILPNFALLVLIVLECIQRPFNF